MKIGIQTRLWGAEMNRRELSRLLEQAAAAGYDGIEIGAQHLDLDRPADLRRLLADSGMEIASLHVAGQFEQPDVQEAALADIARVMGFAAEVGAGFVTVSGREDANKPLADIAAWGDRLNRTGEQCRQHGLRLCHHNHYWEIVENQRELWALCASTDPTLVWLCLDAGWVQHAGGDAAAVCRMFQDRVGYLHLRDCGRDASGALDWADFGQGQVDFAALYEMSVRRGLAWQVVEQEPPDDARLGTPLDVARRARQYLAAMEQQDHGGTEYTESLKKS